MQVVPLKRLLIAIKSHLNTRKDLCINVRYVHNREFYNIVSAGAPSFNNTIEMKGYECAGCSFEVIVNCN